MTASQQNPFAANCSANVGPLLRAVHFVFCFFVTLSTRSVTFYNRLCRLFLRFSGRVNFTHLQWRFDLLRDQEERNFNMRLRFWGSSHQKYDTMTEINEDKPQEKEIQFVLQISILLMLVSRWWVWKWKYILKVKIIPLFHYEAKSDGIFELLTQKTPTLTLPIFHVKSILPPWNVKFLFWNWNQDLIEHLLKFH